MNLPVASCLVCGQEKELAVWVDPAVTGGSFHGVCFQCRQAAQQSLAVDDACNHVNKIFFPSGRVCCSECGLPLPIATKA